MNLLKIIPNPFDQNSTLSDIEKKKELLNDTLEFRSVTLKIIAIIVISIILINKYNALTILIISLASIEVLSSIIKIIIKVKEIKSINRIRTKTNLNYKSIITKNTYWEMMKSNLRFITDSIDILIIYLYTQTNTIEILNKLIEYELIKYIILGIIILRVVNYISQIGIYKKTKKITETKDFAIINTSFKIIELEINRIMILIGTIIIGTILFLSTIPLKITIGITGLLLTYQILEHFSIKRMKNINFNEKDQLKQNKDNNTSKKLKNNINEKIDKSIIKHEIKIIENEKVLNSVFGLLYVAADVKSMFNITGMGILGTGKSNYPENTLITTNKRLLLVQIPVTGGNKIIDKKDYVMENFMYNRKEIKDKGEKILRLNKINKLIKLTINDVYYKDIKTMTFIKTKFIIEKKSGEKLAYLFMEKEYFKPLIKTLKPLLRQKLIIEAEV